MFRNSMFSLLTGLACFAAITVANGRVRRFGATAIILNDSASANRSCVTTRTTPVTSSFNVKWNDGTVSHIQTQQYYHYNYDIGIQGGSGTVLTGLFSGLNVTLDFDLLDDSDGCRTGAGVAHYEGNVTLTIGSLFGSGGWRYCAGKAIITFCPPITIAGTDSTKTYYAYFDTCIGKRTFFRSNQLIG